MSDTVQWFQYKRGIVGESQRVVHCARGADDERLVSWCRREFDPTAVEPTAEPGATPAPGQATPHGPCIPCLLLVTSATETNDSVAAPPARDGLPHGVR